MRSRIGFVLLFAALSACGRRGPAAPDLSRDERILVDHYVRLTVLEQLRADAPDSTEAGFERLARAYDSTAVRRAFDRLSADPRRWEPVYAEIARRLRELEESPDPQAAFREALRAPGKAPARSPDPE